MKVENRSSLTSWKDYDDFVEKIKAGELIGNVFWISSPASTSEGKRREKTCKWSEANKIGENWLKSPRCPKQIAYSCDGCMSHMIRPFYESEDDF